MSSVLSEQGGLADDIVQVAAYEVPEPPKKGFLPWHLPRKQFVRHHQWCLQIQNMLDEHACEGTFRYLGLPGVDLLDLRYFHEQICQPRALRLKFLGFNRAAVPSSEARVSGILCERHTMMLPRSMYATQEKDAGGHAGD